MVEVTRFELAASSSRTKRSTKLSHTSILNYKTIKLKLLANKSRFYSRSSCCNKVDFFLTEKFSCCGHSLLLPSSATGSGRKRPQTEPHLDAFEMLTYYNTKLKGIQVFFSSLYCFEIKIGKLKKSLCLQTHTN